MLLQMPIIEVTAHRVKIPKDEAKAGKSSIAGYSSRTAASEPQVPGALGINPEPKPVAKKWASLSIGVFGGLASFLFFIRAYPIDFIREMNNKA